MSAHGPRGKGDLTQGSVTRHLVRLTLPMIWGLAAMISFQLVNTFYISMLGTKALAAITFTFPVTFTIFSLTLGMSIATSSVISRQIGRGNWPRVRRLTTHALIMAFILGLVLAVGGYFLMHPVFRAMGANEELMPLIDSYMTIWFAGCVFINMPVVGNAAIRATGDTYFPAMVMTVAAVANAVLDPILIFGLLGFPRLEMQGAAISTVFSNGCALLAGLYVIGAHKKMLSRSRHHMRLFGDSAKHILFIAIPAGITSIIQPVTNAVITALLAKYGHDAVAAFGIVSRIEAFAFITIMALAIGMAPIIGQNWGAEKYDRVRETMKNAISFACLWSLFVAAVLVLFARPVAGLFSREAGVIQTAVLFFLIVPPTYVLGNLVPGWSSAFNAMGLPQRSALMIFIRLVVVNIPLVIIGARLYGIAGIFGAIAVTNIVTGIAFHLWNRAFLNKKAAAVAKGPNAP